MNTVEKVGNSKLLKSLALLGTSVFPDDYISTFIPFIATIIQDKKYQHIEIAKLQEDFVETYGFNIPRGPMTTILSRCVNKNLIEKNSDGRFYPNNSVISEVSFLAQQEESKRVYNNILISFLSYVSKNFPDIKISKEEADTIFINFLDNYSPRTIGNEVGTDYVPSTSNKYMYLVGVFVQEAYAHNNEIFREITRLSMAHTIGTAITYDVDVDKNLEEYGSLVLHLDTPIVLRFLGLQTEEFEDVYKDMFDIFNNTIKPEYRIFSHTLDEITNILKDCANWIENPAYNPKFANSALLTFLKRKFTKFEVELYINNIETYLAELNISIDNMNIFDHFSDKYQIDEKILFNKLVETYKQSRTGFDIDKKKYTIDIDIQSIVAIVKLRGNKSAKSFSSSKYLFLTSNSTLAYVCRRFINDYKGRSRNQKPPCITDYFLSTMIWLSSSTKKLENFSHSKLLADCRAATSVSDEQIAQFMDSLERLKHNSKINDNDYLFMRKYAFEQNYIEKRTLNETNAFTDKMIEEILEEIKGEIIAPYQETIKSKDEHLKNLESKNKDLTQKLEKVQTDNDNKNNNNLNRQKKYKQSAEKAVEHIIHGIIPVAIGAFALLILLFTVINNDSGLNDLAKILSGTVTFISCCILGILKCNFMEVKSNLIQFFIKKYQIKEFKKQLK